MNNKHPNTDAQQNQGKSFEQILLDVILKPTIVIPLSSSLVGLALAMMAWDSTSKVLVAIWISMLTVVAVARYVALRYWLPARTELSAQQKLYLATVFSLGAGMILAVSALFFTGYTIYERAVQIILIVSMSTITVISVAGYRLHVLAYAAPPILAISAVWIQDSIASEEWIRLLLAILSLFYLWALVKFADLYHNFFQESYSYQQEQRSLNTKLTAALHDSQTANDSKSLFFASASHDLRQPIHTLSLLTAALSMREMDDKAKDILSRIDIAVENLSSQMDSMLDIARLDAGVFEAEEAYIDCASLLTKIAQEYGPVADKNNIAFSAKVPSDPIFIYSDAELLERIIRNLIDNAIKYTGEGSVSLALSQDHDFVYIAVQDTGIGVKPEDQLRIYDEFYQVSNASRNRKKGLGLGLSIVRRITDLLKISLDFDSFPGFGTTVTLSMPVVLNVVQGEKETLAESYNRDRKLLCIDDEAEVLDAMVILLNDLGYTVLSATNSDEAMDIARTTRPDAVLADFRLTGHDNGIQAINALRTLHEDLPAIIISGDTGKDRLQQAARANIPLLSKPLKVAELERALHALFE